MYSRWRENPTSVHPSWDVYFKSNVPTSSSADASKVMDTTRIIHMIRAYQVRGHEVADIDPLGMLEKSDIPELDPKSYGFTEADMDREMGTTDLMFADISGILKMADLNGDNQTTLRELLTFLKMTYCGVIGYDFMHIPERDRCNWLRDRVEKLPTQLDKKKRLQIFERLAFAEKFELFCANKWNTAKRFGVEGLEALTPGLKAMVDRASELGVKDMVFGMPHRGRLNVLVNVIRKPTEMVFKEFAGTSIDESGKWTGSGDVKYHLGTNFTRTYPDGRTVNLSMTANPSHLEAVDPVVIGKAKAKMHFNNDPNGDETMAILLHGDAAFAGQGIVYETMQCSQLEHYQTGGTIHVICNNQVGFTTKTSDGRSTRYASDLGKAFNCPIFHANADHPEEVCNVFELATEWRQKFKTDVIIDLIGYRRHGHNELDQPFFTQPLMYKRISSHNTALRIHIDRLLKDGVSQEEIDNTLLVVDEALISAFEASKGKYAGRDLWTSVNWATIKKPDDFSKPNTTGVPREKLDHIAPHLTQLPAGFNVHRQVQKVLDHRAKLLREEDGTGIDWGSAEGLAFGTLLQEGIHVRLSGEDVERGTFSHRHANVHDQMNGNKHSFLNAIPNNQQTSVVCNSPLSEYGVMGFDLGYSLEHPHQLVCWEAQFGDFVNGAQIIIDQFLTSGESKWNRQCGLVLLLPHGYDGNGPDHSSCRVERFLQSSDEDPDSVPDMAMQVQSCNWQIVNCTTPANYFHVLRRQVKRDFRKPLIVMSPKNLLRLRECISPLSDMESGTSFQRILPEAHPKEIVASSEVRRLVLCSGKIYYELLAARRAGEIKDVAIVRLEQITPFPFDLIAEQITSYDNAEVVWVQEEPKNMGCWSFVCDRIMTATRVLNNNVVLPAYVGRGTMASTAEGYGQVHHREQAQIIATALSDEVTAYGHGREVKWGSSITHS